MVNYRKHPTFNTVYTVLMAVLRVVRCIIWHSATKYFWKTEAHVLVVRFLRKTLYLLRSDLTQGMQNLWLTFFKNIKLTNKALSFASLPLIPLLSLKWMKNKYRRFLVKTTQTKTKIFVSHTIRLAEKNVDSTFCVDF